MNDVTVWRQRLRDFQTFLRMLILSITMLGGVGLIGGCNTIEGAGEDIEATGEAIDDAADDDE